MTPFGPNLSHWPGNRTPSRWKADLSTGIAFRFLRDDPAEQAAFLGEVQLVVNDHYDTDGFGSLLVLLNPGVATVHEELLLAAAATGDFGCWQTWRAFAIDRIVARLASPASPVAAEFAGIVDPTEKSLRRYRWLLEHAAEWLRSPEQFAAVYAEEMAMVQQQIADGLGGAMERRRFAEIDLAVLVSRGARHRMTLNTLAGAYRVLHVQEEAFGRCYRFHDRTESWFELLTFHALPRRDLRPVAKLLDAMEPARDGFAWCADPPGEPIPELWFGIPGAQAYGQVTRVLAPSRLDPERVVAALVDHFSKSSPCALSPS